MADRKCYLKLFFFLHENKLARVGDLLTELCNEGAYYVQLFTLTELLERVGVEFQVAARDDFFILTTKQGYLGNSANVHHYFKVKFNNRDFYHVLHYVGSVDYLIPCRFPAKTATSTFDSRFVGGTLLSIHY
jgi:hypothetical protein